MFGDNQGKIVFFFITSYFKSMLVLSKLIWTLLQVRPACVGLHFRTVGLKKIQPNVNTHQGKHVKNDMRRYSKLSKEFTSVSIFQG